MKNLPTKHLQTLKDAYVWIAVVVALGSLIYPYLRYADVAWFSLVTGVAASLLGAAATALSIRLRERIRSRNAPRVFISYAHKDSKVAMDIASRLERMGATPVIDKMELAVGDDIASAVRRLMEGSDYYLVVLTPAFLQSSWAQRELEAALDLNKRVLPILLSRDSVPERLKGVVYADFTSSPDLGYEQLEKTIKRQRAQEG